MDLVFRRTLGPDRTRILSEPDFEGWLKSLLGFDPKDIMPFQRAMTHGSTGKADYQRLEFLGDRVLGLTIAEMLFQGFPDEPEGKLSHRLNNLVSGANCARIAREINLPQHVKLGKQARDDGARDSDNVLGDVMEALIGALYLEAGPEAAQRLIAEHWKPRMQASDGDQKHPKSRLQEWCAANTRKTPEYALVSKEGPPHAMRFTVSVSVKGFAPVAAEANSKQAAETSAAQAFLEQNT